MRPASLIWFERLYIASLLVSIGNAAMQLRNGTANLSFAVVIGLQVLILAALIALTLGVSRKRNTIAMWVILALFAFRLVSFAYSLTFAMFVTTRVVMAAHTLLQTVAVALLLTPSARSWLSRKDAPATEAQLRRTFD